MSDVDRDQRFTGLRHDVEATELRLYELRIARALRSARRVSRTAIEEVVACQIVVGRDVKRRPRLNYQEWVVAYAPFASVVGHKEHHVAPDKSGGPVVLQKVVGV